MNNENKSRAIGLIKKLAVRPAITNQETRIIESVGTQRDYADCIKLYLDWCDWSNVTAGLRGSKAWLMF